MPKKASNSQLNKKRITDTLEYDRMRKITIVLLSSLLIIALGACKKATHKVENGKPALMWFDA